jgi:hypothetical protein
MRPPGRLGLIRRRYAVVAEFEDSGPPGAEVISFPEPAWWAIGVLLLAGDERLEATRKIKVRATVSTTEAVEADAIRRDPIGSNLASLNDIVMELVDSISDPAFAALVRDTLKAHSHALGYAFQGEHNHGAAVPRPGSAVTFTGPHLPGWGDPDAAQ